jgi:hypothetical protein
VTDVVYRLQAEDGRGPFRPGFSRVWLDSVRRGPDPNDLPPFYEELGWTPGEVSKRIPQGYYGGCACRTVDQLHQWFSRSERRRLARFGYRIVSFKPDLIIAETKTQLVFAHRDPLWTLKPIREAAE